MLNTKNTWLKLLLWLSVFIGAVLFVSLLYRSNETLFLVLIIASVILLKKGDKIDLLAFLVSMVAGPIGEIVAIYFGAWEYSNPSFIGIPIWLPLLWGIAGITLRRIPLLVSNLL